MTTHARITYFLSEAGRRDSLRKGGNGKRLQGQVGMVDDVDLAAFDVDDEGNVCFDLTLTHGLDPDFNPGILPLASKGHFNTTPFAIEWDIVPEWEDLLAVVKGFKAEEDGCEAARFAEQAERYRISDQFQKNPGARASFVSKDYVVIDSERFTASDAVFFLARERWEADQEELKKANRATLGDWIARHGTENQRKRLAASLLPWAEAFTSAEECFYRPLVDFKLYSRFDPINVCVCEYQCDVKFQSFDATELSSDEWEKFEEIQAAVPGATFQLREHRAQCKSQQQPQIRRGVIVKFTLGQLGFKREFALQGAL